MTGTKFTDFKTLVNQKRKNSTTTSYLDFNKDDSNYVKSYETIEDEMTTKLDLVEKKMSRDSTFQEIRRQYETNPTRDRPKLMEWHKKLSSVYKSIHENREHLNECDKYYETSVEYSKILVLYGIISFDLFQYDTCRIVLESAIELSGEKDLQVIGYYCCCIYYGYLEDPKKFEDHFLNAKKYINKLNNKSNPNFIETYVVKNYMKMLHKIEARNHSKKIN